MAAESNFKNMLLSLSVTCLICSAALAGVYAVTKEPIAETEKAQQAASISKVLPEGGEISEACSCEVGGLPSECWFSTRDGKTIATAVKSTVSGFGGPLTLMVGILPDGTVYNTVVLSHNETPGLGAKCATDSKFIDQFKGWAPGRKLSVGKDGGDVDAITASTITSRAYAKAIDNALHAISALSADQTAGSRVAE